MEMAQVQTDNLPFGEGISQIEFVGSDDIGFTPDAEKLALQRICQGGRAVFGFEDFIEGLPEKEAGSPAVEGAVLGAVGNPEVVQGCGLELAAEEGGDPAAALDVIDPESPGLLFRTAQGEALGCFRMRKTGGVEIKLQLLCLCPVQPAPEM